MEIITIIIGVVIISLIIWTGLYYLLRYLKGSLTIRLDKNNLVFGETLSGTLKLKAKKQIKSNRLFVALIKEEDQRSYNSRRGSSGSWVEVSRQEQTIEESKTYPMNFSNIYQFQIQIPSINSTQNIQNGIIKTMVNLFKGRVRWKIISRLDAEGVDLYTNKIISINEPINQTLQN